MQKNVIINKVYENEYVSEITEELPLLFCKNKGVKIELMKVEFKKSLLYFVNKENTNFYVKDNGKYLNISTNKDENKDKIDMTRMFDVYNNKYVELPEKASTICYMSTDEPNNTVILKNSDFGSTENIYFNMIATNFISPDGECFLESGWLDKRDKLKFYFYDENFNKLFIKEFFLNLKVNFNDEFSNNEF